MKQNKQKLVSHNHGLDFGFGLPVVVAGVGSVVSVVVAGVGFEVVLVGIGVVVVVVVVVVGFGLVVVVVEGAGEVVVEVNFLPQSLGRTHQKRLVVRVGALVVGVGLVELVSGIVALFAATWSGCRGAGSVAAVEGAVVTGGQPKMAS